MATRLLFDQVTKRFGAKTALEALSISVEAGEIFGFLGPNGAGKTTALQLAMGFLRPSSGHGELLGCSFTDSRAARAQVGYVPDAPVFFPGTPLQAMLLSARLNGNGRSQPANDVKERAQTLLRRLDLPTERADACKLSRGQQQRLALAQALATRPSLLILDEPTSALDPPGVILIREALEQARGEGTAVFFSSHQLKEVEQICDRAAFLHEGRLLQSGSMAGLLQEGATARIVLRGLTPEHPFVHAAAARLKAEAGRPRGDLVFAVPLAEQRPFLERAWAAGAELVRVEREHRTLEDLFAGVRGHAAGVSHDR